MTAHEGDPRTGPEESGFVTITSGTNAPQTAVSIPSDALYKIAAIKIEYDPAATVDNIEVGLFDDADGTGAGAVADQRDIFNGLSPGESRMITETVYRDFEEDVLVQADGNHDDDIDVTVYGQNLIALKDV